uniref:TctD-like protein n=1 Tax=Riquetophycus sp. TaxID=1897556 RepID=A0A1C9C8C4_9FLOR|nr:hypothetical protein Riqu_151 [Riquetophycus sp.]
MKKQILIVDDDINLKDSIVNYLISVGFQVSSANNVYSALKQINQKKPDMIITDIMMPTLDGYDLIKELNSDHNLINIPVIFLTAKGMTQDRIKGYDLGCSAYLVKPFDPHELLSIVNNIFRNINSTQVDSYSSTQLLEKNNNSCFLNKLTPRERTILYLVMKGYRNKEIAQRLNVSIRNVEKYVSRLLSKTETRNRTQLAQLAASIDLNHFEGE